MSDIGCNISVYHIFGLLLAVALIEFFGIVSVKKVKNANDFSTGGGKVGTWSVCGIIIGTLIGGQSTIGTAQMAFSYGISAWWFTIGAALGAFVLGIGYAVPIRRSGSSTLMEIVSREYGKKAEVTGSVLCAIGIFVSIIAQVISASALIMTLFPVKIYVAAIVATLVMIFYVVFGGVMSAGLGGIVKVVLLCLTALLGGAVVLVTSGGYSGLNLTINELLVGTDMSRITGLTSCDAISDRYANMFARGVSKDVCSCLSVVLGVLSTQSYAQGIWAAKSDSVARKGSMAAALIAVPIGAACVFIGLYMRGHYITVSEYNAMIDNGLTVPENIRVIASSAQAFPVFVTNHLPKFIGGLMLGTMLITVIIGGAGLTLGASSIIVRDVYPERWRSLKTTRMTIVFIMTAAAVAGISFSGNFINDLGFLSMGLRATAVFTPLTLALFLPKRFKSKWILISIIAGTATLFIIKILKIQVDAVFVGLGVSMVCCLLGKIV